MSSDLWCETEKRMEKYYQFDFEPKKKWDRWLVFLTWGWFDMAMTCYEDSTCSTFSTCIKYSISMFFCAIWLFKSTVWEHLEMQLRTWVILKANWKLADLKVIQLFCCSVVRLFGCSVVRLFCCSVVRLLVYPATR